MSLGYSTRAAARHGTLCFAEDLRMLEFVIYLISGIGYGFYFDLNPLETLLVALAILGVFRGWWPRFPRFRVTRAWRAWTRLAYRRKTAVAAVFVFALLIRAALLPVLPAPNPVVTDEFSHLLIADTLAHGRLTNPTHPMWVHFESIHIIQKPTYNSDYFPGQGAVLALGKRMGHPWVAAWLLCAAMCAALCWMLQGWIPPAWALFGAMLAVFRFGIASYWVNGYYGGCLAALGGALVLGSYPRLLKKPKVSTSFLFGLGLAIIGYARPFEGLAVAVPAAVAIAIAMLRRKTPAWVGVPATAVVLMAVAGLLAYSKAVTGDPLKTPYAVNQATYGWPMTLPWFHPPEVQFRHEELRRYYDYEKDVHDRNATPWAELKNSTLKGQEMWRFYFGPALSIGLITLPLVWRKPAAASAVDRRCAHGAGRADRDRKFSALCGGRHGGIPRRAGGMFPAATGGPPSVGIYRSADHAANSGSAPGPGSNASSFHSESQFSILVLREAGKSEQGANSRYFGSNRQPASGASETEDGSRQRLPVDLQRCRHRRVQSSVGA